MKKSARSIESSQRKWRNRWWLVASGSVVEEMTPWIHRAALAAIIMSHSLCHLWNGLEDRLIRFDQIHPLHFLGFDWILLDAFKFDSIPLHWIEFSRIPFNSIRSQLHFLGLFRILLDSVGFYWVYRNGALFPGGGGGGRGKGERDVLECLWDSFDDSLIGGTDGGWMKDGGGGACAPLCRISVAAARAEFRNSGWGPSCRCP